MDLSILSEPEFSPDSESGVKNLVRPTYRVYTLSPCSTIHKQKIAHSIFEGLAIGLQDDNSKLWLLAMIVLVHKSLFALVIGLAALRSLPGIIKDR